MTKRKGHKNGVATLMHLPEGQTSDWNPYNLTRMHHTKGVCIAIYKL